MKRHLITALLLAAVLSCVKEAPAVRDDVQPTPGQEAAESSLISGEAIVEFTEEFTALVEKDFAEDNFLSTKAGGAADVFSAMGVTSVRRLYDDGGKWEARQRRAGLHRWYRINYDESLSATKAEADLSTIPGVVYVEPARRIKSTAVFNDPMLSSQWHYYNAGSGRNMETGCDINVEPVWEYFTAGSPNVIVGIIDGGVQMDHPDLAASMIPSGEDGSWSFVHGYQGYTIYPHDHGTHVAGTVGAINNNGTGVCGVAGGSDGDGGVKMLSCAIFKKNPSDPKHDIGGDTYNAMVYAANHGAVIAQNSWGYVYDTAADAKRGGVGAMKAAIDYFIDYAGCDEKGNQLPDSPMKGGVVIFAAGNENWTDGWPAEYEPVIAVGSFGADYTRASYSNYGPWVDICAPGGDGYYGVLSTINNGGYGYMQGTSMACPHVSGVAALIVSRFGGRGFTNEMLKERLLGGADNGTKLSSENIGPKLDAFGSFNYGDSVPPQSVESYSAVVQSNSIGFKWKVTSDKDSPDGKCYSYLILASENKSDFDGFKVSSVPQSMFRERVVVGNSAKVGDELGASLSRLKFGTEYYVGIVACDYNMNPSAMSELKRLKTDENQAPVIESSYSGNYKVHSHETLVLDYNIYDPDGHEITVNYRKGSEAEKFVSKDGKNTLTIIGNGAAAGKYTAMIAAKDDTGFETADRTTIRMVTYEIVDNHAPKLIKSGDGILMTHTGETLEIDLTKYVLDEDGETLKYEIARTNPRIANIRTSGNSLIITSLYYGKDEISLTARDFRNESSIVKFKLVVRAESSGADVYPTTVKDYLTVATGELGPATIRIWSASGTVIYEKCMEVGVFAPAVIDMRSFAPGIYRVIVESSGIKTEKTIVRV